MLKWSITIINVAVPDRMRHEETPEDCGDTFQYARGCPDANRASLQSHIYPTSVRSLQNTGIGLARKGKWEASGTMKSCQIKPLSFQVICMIRPWRSKVCSDMDVPIWPNGNPGIRFLSEFFSASKQPNFKEWILREYQTSFRVTGHRDLSWHLLADPSTWFTSCRGNSSFYA